MTDDDHLIGLGKIIGNLQALEHVLRIFLCEVHGQKIEYPASGIAELAETHLTDFASLDKVVAVYDASLSAQEQQYRVDPAVVKVRDALAHGRVTSLSTTFPVTLYKFGRADGNKRVPVEYAVLLTKEWFEEKRKLLFGSIQKVTGCSESRGYKYLKSNGV